MKKTKNSQSDGPTWVAITSQAKMKIFKQTPGTGELHHLTTIENPMVDSSDTDISRHTPGVSMEGGRHHVMSGGDSPHDIETAAFIRAIAVHLDHERRQHNVSHLIIAAEPRLLGHLKAQLSTETLQIVSQWIDKDLEKEPTEKLLGRVSHESTHY
jgi:protein required for attachment to host cells